MSEAAADQGLQQDVSGAGQSGAGKIKKKKTRGRDETEDEI